jgi:hypothetical protein
LLQTGDTQTPAATETPSQTGAAAGDPHTTIPVIAIIAIVAITVLGMVGAAVGAYCALQCHQAKRDESLVASLLPGERDLSSDCSSMGSVIKQFGTETLFE